MDPERVKAFMASAKAWKEMVGSRHEEAAQFHEVAKALYTPDDLQFQVHLRAIEIHRRVIKHGSLHAHMDTVRAEQIRGWMWPIELQMLAYLAAGMRSICEIGSAFGRSTRALGDHVAKPNGRVYAIDSWAGAGHFSSITNEVNGEDDFNVFKVNLQDLIDAGTVIPIRMKSKEAAEKLKGSQYDMVFIDGDHSYAACRSDIKLFGPMLGSGSLLVGHDYYQLGVFRAVKEEIGNVDGVWGRLWWVRM